MGAALGGTDVSSVVAGCVSAGVASAANATGRGATAAAAAATAAAGSGAAAAAAAADGVGFYLCDKRQGGMALARAQHWMTGPQVGTWDRTGQDPGQYLPAFCSTAAPTLTGGRLLLLLRCPQAHLALLHRGCCLTALQRLSNGSHNGSPTALQRLSNGSPKAHLVTFYRGCFVLGLVVAFAAVLAYVWRGVRGLFTVDFQVESR
jgi:hypothetical protein